ncbi:MAG: hypothetical protein Kow0029_26710 [Candidatus Rifleibacteriota bacterium]
MLVCNRKAITFLEIVIAVAILVVAMIPLFGLMSRETVETDKNASEAFAINKASEILNSVLDNIPFAALRQGNPGYVKVSDLKGKGFDKKFNDNWASSLMTMLFGAAKKEAAGYQCRGIVTDSRGIHYLVHMRVEDVASERGGHPDKIKIGSSFPKGKPSAFTEIPELTFSYLKNPELLNDGSWTVDYAETDEDKSKPLTEMDLGAGKGVAEPKENIYLDQGMESYGADAARFVNPTALRYTQRMISQKVPYDTSDAFAYCTMKKLLVQVQWNLDQQYFKTPEETRGRVRRIHLMTIKGDID